MTYLIMQMLFCLLIAFILGVIVGLMACKAFCKKKKLQNSSQTLVAFDDSDDEDLDDFIDEEETADPIIMPDLNTDHGDEVVDADDDMSDIDSDQDLDDASFSIQKLEGVGPRTADLFATAGIHTIGDYLRKLYTPDSRDDLAQSLEIKVQPIHDWASMSDLMRIESVSNQNAELLYAAGIRTTGDLANAETEKLTIDMAQVNNAGKQKIAPEDPDETLVAHWIERAKTKKSVVRV